MISKAVRKAAYEALEPRVLLSTTYYVSPSGSDSHAGSSDATAFATLQHAADTVQPGDTVIVRAGAYAHGFELPFNQGATQRISFLADPGVVITGPSTSGPSGNNGLAIEIGYNFSNSVSASMEPVTISGFTIDGTNKSITDCGIYLMWADGSIIQNNTIHDTGAQGILAKYSSNILLQYNVAHDCGFNNVNGYTDRIHGIYVTDSCNHPTIRWNTLYHNLDSGLHLNGDANSGLYPQAGDHSGMISNALIENNVIYNNVLNGMNLDGMQNSVVRNNLLYQNGQLSGHKDITIFDQDAANSPHGNAIYNNTLTSTITTQTHHNINMNNGTGSSNDNAVFNNIVYQPWGTNGDAPILIDSSVASGTVEDYNAMTSEAVASDGSPHNVSIPGDDPTSLFVNFAALDYHLKAGSVAIDHGVASLNGFSASAIVNGFAPTDLGGNTRPQGGGYDLGAYEFVQATTAPAAPSALAATPADPVSITLNWTDNSNNETSFLIERSTDGVNFTQIASVAANTTTYTDPALTSGASYSYRVRAANSAGNSSYSNTASAVAPAAPAPPAAPTALSATAASSSQINLSWSESSSNITGFLIERSTDGLTFTQIATTAASVTTYSNTGLTASTQYSYRVRVTNSGSNSGYSNTAAVTTLPTVPVAPSALTATAASTSQINLSWTDNSTNETAFLIERSPDGVTFTQIASVVANVTTYSDTGLSASTAYTYRVRATNSAGNSAYSRTARATTQSPAPTIPAAPSSLAATSASSAQINLSWTDNSNNETAFLIERSTDGVNFTQIATVAAGVTAYNNTGLTASTQYTYRVRATNSAGNSTYSNAASATTNAPAVTAPAAPTGLAALAVSPNQVNLSWTDKSSNETGFMIERSTDNVNFAQLAAVGANVTSFIDAGVSPNMVYTYRVRATNSAGNSAYTNTAVATTPAVVPAAPSNLSAVAASPTQINLAWVDSANDQTGFKVERSTDGVNFVQIASVGASVASYADVNLASGVSYSYQIVATNSAGDSSPSAIATAMTPAPIQPALTDDQKVSRDLTQITLDTQASRAALLADQQAIATTRSADTGVLRTDNQAIAADRRSLAAKHKDAASMAADKLKLGADTRKLQSDLARLRGTMHADVLHWRQTLQLDHKALQADRKQMALDRRLAAKRH